MSVSGTHNTDSPKLGPDDRAWFVPSCYCYNNLGTNNLGSFWLKFVSKFDYSLTQNTSSTTK